MTNVVTRSSTSRYKARQDALKHLCAVIIKESDEVSTQTTVERSVTSSLKLVDYRRQLNEVNTVLLESSTNYSKDLIETEAFDQICLEASEKLYRSLPTDHELKGSMRPSHLRSFSHVPAGGDGLPNSNQPTGEDFLKVLQKPKLEEFDGKNVSWPLWKATFEKAINENDKLDVDQKFFYLMANLKKGCSAHKLASTYTGIENAFQLAWKDLTEHYQKACDVREIHVIALRDLQKKFKVTDARKFRQIEDLFQAVKSHTNALKALGANPASYESLALLGIKEALPFDLRVKYFLDNEAISDLDLNGMLEFLEKEIQARRNSWTVEPEKTFKKDIGKSNWAKNTSEAKDRRGKESPGFRPKQRQEKRQSSMFQEASQTENSVEDLNE